MRIPQSIVLFAAILIVPSGARAAEVPEGHSFHGEAFNEGPRQAAELMDHVFDAGGVEFPVTTAKPLAQKFFTQGIVQLHGFWYFEAERSFRQVAAIDPDCAMAYWGMAMANINNEKRAAGLLTKATERKESVTPREQLWISALENYYREDDKRERKARELDFISDLETIVQEHPDDVEAKAFLVWRIWAAKKHAPINSHQAVDALLDQIFAVNPNHPAHHYRIHLWDNKKPVRAVSAAAQCGQSAPGIAHLWHMPGHTYAKLKRHEDAAWHQEASSRVDHEYMIRSLILPDQIHNYAHNEEWLSRTFNDLGRARDAIGLAKSLVANPRHPKYNTLDKGSSSASYGRTRLLDSLVLWRLWDEVIELNDTVYLEPAVQAGHDARRLRSLAVAHFHRGDSRALETVLDDLEKLKARETKQKKEAAEKAKKAEEEEKAGDAKKAEDKKPAPPAKKGSPAKRKPKKSDVDRAINETRALIAILGDDPEATKRLQTAAPDIPKDRLARYWLLLGEDEKAGALEPNLPQTVTGDLVRVDVLLARGKEGEARPVFNRLRRHAAALDENLPAAAHMTELASRFGVTGDWRQPRKPATDIGVRPDQETLGPMHWHPPVAPFWQGRGLDGKMVRQGEFAPGKPTIVVFYLGHECTHCMDQLVTFAKAADRFEKAGLALVAISSERFKTLDGALKKSPTPGSLPFPILADPQLKSFRNYRAYDDFEEMALHAVALVDAKGRLRWIDSGYEPFEDVDFLLKESVRLLAL